MKKIIILLSMVALSYPLSAKENTTKTNNGKTINVEIGKKGFTPSSIEIKKGQNLTLNVKRTTDKTCMKELKNPINGSVVKLPLDKEIIFKVGVFKSEKTVKILCGMDMKAGVIVVN